MTKFFAMFGFIAMIASACGALGASDTEQTLAAENQSLKTRAAFARSTATLEADTIFITLEHAQTAIMQVDQQQQNLIATLIERGIATESIANITPATQLPLFPTSAPNPGATNPENPGAADAPIISAAPAPTILTPPSLANIVMAEDVGDDDCASGITTQFTPNHERIYIVATAANITVGMTITSRWMRDATEFASFDFAPDFAIDGACIWFFIDQTDIIFTPGNLSVQLEIDGAPVGAPIPFTIVAS